MFITVKNELGAVTIDKEVLAKIAGLAAMDCYGIVGMAAKNVKDGLVYLLKKERITKGVRLSMDKTSLKINLHIIVEYGTNITAIAETLKSNVKYKVEEQSGLSVGQVNVFIEGVRINKPKRRRG
ncbi:MAG: Asp23/Gls24 family envelope stress response protein [Defluviitaleaceae bacterium]|nr:Asp23/Gls24 family envelope stress response protein [Defluviitaleaceae bacterium]